MKGKEDLLFIPVQMYRRRELYERFGGQGQGGGARNCPLPLVLGDHG